MVQVLYFQSFIVGVVIASIRCDTAWEEREMVRSCLNGAENRTAKPVERAVILSDNGVLHGPLPTTGAEGVFNLPTTLKGSECALILQTLQAVGWVIGRAKGPAARLGLKRTTLINRMSRMGISRPPFQSRHDVIGSAA